MQQWRAVANATMFEMCQLQFSWPQALNLPISQLYDCLENIAHKQIDTSVIATEHEQICDVFATIWE